MQKIMFSEKFGLQQAVLNGSKTMTRRIEPTLSQLPEDIAEDEYLIQTIGEDSIIVERCYKGAKLSSWVIRPRFYLFEKIAVAQRYWDLRNNDGFYEALQRVDPSFPLECIKGEKGCHNKMFVRADWMPHQIEITDYRVERLRNISEEDCLKEGIIKRDDLIITIFFFILVLLFKITYFEQCIDYNRIFKWQLQQWIIASVYVQNQSASSW